MNYRADAIYTPYSSLVIWSFCITGPYYVLKGLTTASLLLAGSKQAVRRNGPIPSYNVIFRRNIHIGPYTSAVRDHNVIYLFI